jgi:hypothetical protein
VSGEEAVLLTGVTDVEGEAALFTGVVEPEREAVQDGGTAEAAEKRLNELRKRNRRWNVSLSGG